MIDDNECQGVLKVNYDTLRAAFENLFTTPFASNLPKRKKDGEVGSIKNTQFSRPGIGRDVAMQYGINKVFKSFIFDNIALTFRVKGQPYRDPGKFIQINVDVKTLNNNNDLSEINGYWYVVAVNHIFENDTYYNDFTCVKFYSVNGSVSPITSQPYTSVVKPSATPEAVKAQTPSVPDGDFSIIDSTIPPLPETSSEIPDGSVLPERQP